MPKHSHILNISILRLGHAWWGSISENWTATLFFVHKWIKHVIIFAR